VAKGANPQNACILQILAIIGNFVFQLQFPSSLPHYCKKNYKLFYSIIKSISIFAPKRQLRGCNYRAAITGLQLQGCNYRAAITGLQLQGCNYRAARAWGGKGGSALPPKK
jgi:hypothetical protein